MTPPIRPKALCCTAAAGAVAARALLGYAAPARVALAAPPQTGCGTTALCPADPALEGGDQAAAERRIIDG